MTLYGLVLFSHIAGAFFLFAGLVLEGVAVSYLRRNAERMHAKPWFHVAWVAPRFYGPALGIILLSGLYIGTKMEAWRQGWILVSLITLFIVGLIGAAFTAPRVRAMSRSSKENPEGQGGAPSDRSRDRMLLASVGIRVALVLGVLLLMVSKVNLTISLITIVSAGTLGAVFTVPAWRPQTN